MLNYYKDMAQCIGYGQGLEQDHLDYKQQSTIFHVIVGI